MQRRKSAVIHIGQQSVGGDFPITVQSMTNTQTQDVEATIAQISDLVQAGCDLVRVAVPHIEAAEAISKIKEHITIPIIADIHFDYRLALKALEQGVDALRLNPGNIGDDDRVKQVVTEAKKRHVPIRIGVNAGSLHKAILAKYDGKVTAHGLVDSALEHVHLLEKLNFYDIKISLKAHNVPMTIEAYRLMAQKVSYPFHLGITEAGTYKSGVIKSAVGIGTLLAEGIGDTLRVSLTGNPVDEVRVGNEILKSLGLKEYGPTLVSCPTCGRCQINLAAIAHEVEEKLSTVKKPITVAVMGCIVNGPGEAKDAEVGIAGGHGDGLLFRKGQIVRKVPEEQLVAVLFEEIDQILRED